MKNRKYILIIITVLLISTIIKLYLAYIFSYHICGDTATIGLMAKQILRGDFPLFFYNGYYTIPIESLGISLFFFLFGISSYTLFLGPIFVSILFSITTFYLGRELKNTRTGILALIYTAFPPYYLFKYGTSPIGYLIELILLGNLIIYFTWKVCGENKHYLYFICLGIFGGLAFWTHYIALYYLIPSFIFITINLLAERRFKFYILGGLLGLTSFFIIGLPWWHFCLTNDFICFKFPGMAIQISKFSLLKKFIFYQIPGILALYMSKLDFFNIANLIIYAISFVFFFLFSKKAKNWLFLLIFVSMMLFFCHGGAFAGIKDHRYVLPIFSIIPLMTAYFLDWIENKKKYLGICILLYLVFSNSLNIARGISVDKAECKKHGDVQKQLMDFFDKNNIEGVYGTIGDLGSINFLGKDKIFASQFFDSDAPFDGNAQAANRIAYINDDRIPIVLDKLCKSYERINIGPYRLIYNLKPWDYYGEEIVPFGWKVKSNYNQSWAQFAFDRNLDRYWSSIGTKTKGMYYEIEFPKVYKIYKFQIFNMPGMDLRFPESYKIFVSKDGVDWKLVDECEAAYPVFWSGPRLSWHLLNTRWEVIFKPVEARFIRIEQTGLSRYPWEINEIMFYEYKGDRIFKIKDYVKSAKYIYYFLKNAGIDFVYTDYWLSEKIKLWSKNKIGVLSIYNGFYQNRKNLKRMIQLNKKRAIVVEKAHMYPTERILTEFELPYKKKVFGEYVCYYFLPKTEKDNYFLNNQKSLYWIGIGMAKINLRGFGELLMNCGEYLKAVKYFPTNLNLRYKLLEIYKNEGQKNFFLKEKQIIKHRLTPDLKCNVEFSGGITFLGLSLKHLKETQYKINYFWKIKENPIYKIFVFVHFVLPRDVQRPGCPKQNLGLQKACNSGDESADRMELNIKGAAPSPYRGVEKGTTGVSAWGSIKDGAICFQNDHPLLEQYVRLPVAAGNNVYRESYIIKIPPHLQTDEYVIRLGVCIPSRNGERLKIIGSKSNYVELGGVKIEQDSLLKTLKGRVVFQSDATGNLEIYTMDASGRHIKRLTNTNSENCYPSWSPDGKSIVFQSKRDGNGEIYIMSSNGDRQQNITNNPSNDINPSWHPDGKRIIFTSDRDGTMNFYLINSDRTNLVKLTDFKDYVNDMVCISSSGKEIVFTSNMGEGWHVFKMDLESKDIQDYPNANCEGILSHSGEKISFVSRPNSRNSEICIMDKDGNNIRQLTDHPDYDYKPRFSPDDKKIIFTSKRDGNWELYVMDMDNCKPIRITYTDTNEEWADWTD